ncbi:hypothetical protein CH281_20375 [Rhodococcus sp. 06-221-2]|uniref:excisionase family DNA-binding protein n=1 Tax=unclassified Rhodococcus (in: high G+C Gram-positive bacteria) TaxID=192944 RepID=UPI000B9A747B|nr:excisionase family DNA-binding protein [Rhodococcus sp. 06-221-2]OZC98923.1 hypothetical protein CH281_20375 [Rhodococcus sp. 06-221-2]
MSPPARPGVASVATAAEYMNCHPATIRRMIATGSLPAYRVGTSRTLRIRFEDLDAMLTPVQK